MSTTLEARTLGSRPRRWWLWRALRSLVVAAGVFALIWWLWPYVPDEVRCPPDVGWFSRPKLALISPDGAQALTSDDLQNLRIWDMRQGKLLRQFNFGLPTSSGTNYGGRYLGIPNQTSFRYFDLESGRELLPRTRIISQVGQSGEDMLLLVQSGKVHEIWSLLKEEMVLRLPAELSAYKNAELRYASILENPETLSLTYSTGGAAPSQLNRLFFPRTGLIVDPPAEFQLPTMDWMTWSAQGRYLAGRTHNGRVLLAELATGRTLELARASPGRRVTSMVFKNDEGTLAVAFDDGRVEFRDLPTGCLRSQLVLPSVGQAKWNGIHYLPDQNYLMAQHSGKSETAAKLNQWLKDAGLAARLGRFPEYVWRTWVINLDTLSCYPLPWQHHAGTGKTATSFGTSDENRLYLWSLPPKRPWQLAFAWASAAAGAWWLLEAGLARSRLWLRTAKPASSA